MRTRILTAVLVGVVSAGQLVAAPPTLTIPAELKATGEYVTYSPSTDTTAKAVTYVGLSGIEPFPSAFLKDSRAFVLPVRGLATGRYKFRAVGSLNDEHATADFVVVVGDAPAPVPPPDPTPPTPTPIPPTGALYFVIVRADGPASPEFTKAMADPNWATLRAAGHSLKDKTVSDAAKLGITPGSTLPCVVTLRTTPTSSTIVRGPVPLPTGADILKLPEGVK